MNTVTYNLPFALVAMKILCLRIVCFCRLKELAVKWPHFRFHVTDGDDKAEITTKYLVENNNYIYYPSRSGAPFTKTD